MHQRDQGDWGTSPAGLSDNGWVGACQDHLVSLESEFTDVTLASEDGQLVEAHKVILACCGPSPFTETKTPTP